MSEQNRQQEGPPGTNQDTNKTSKTNTESPAAGKDAFLGKRDGLAALQRRIEERSTAELCPRTAAEAWKTDPERRGGALVVLDRVHCSAELIEHAQRTVNLLEQDESVTGSDELNQELQDLKDALSHHTHQGASTPSRGGRDRPY
jgi:hypothetical protein